MVPTRTVNLSRQSEQKYQPGPMDWPPSLVTVSNWPQNGQTGPSGQREASRNSRALSSLVKAGLVRSHMAVSYNLEYAINLRFSQLYSCPILNIGRMDEGMKQQAQCVYEN